MDGTIHRHACLVLAGCLSPYGPGYQEGAGIETSGTHLGARRAMASLARVRRFTSVGNFERKIMKYYTILKTKHLGDLLLIASAKHLTGIYFMGCDHVPDSRKDWELNPAHPVL